MINVKDHGAKGDGITDDWQALQDLINAFDGALYFPSGRYVISDTLTIPRRSAYHLVGSGLSPILDASSPAVGAASSIVWCGPDGGTMIRYKGSGLVWSGLALWGTNPSGRIIQGSSSSSCPGGHAKYGINVYRPSGGGVPTGKAWFESILIADCEEAISTDSEIDAHADNLAFGYCWFEDCTVGLHLTHKQAMGYAFQYVHAKNVDTIFLVDEQADPSGQERNFFSGGQIFTQAVAVQSSNTTVLNVKDGGTDKSHFALGGVVIHESANNVVLLDNVPNSGGDMHFRFTNGHFRNSMSAVIDWSSKGSEAHRCVLELVGCRGLSALRTEDPQGNITGNITINGAVNNGTPSWLIVRDCEVPTGTDPDPVESLINDNPTQYGYNGVGNWNFNDGVVADESGP